MKIRFLLVSGLVLTSLIWTGCGLFKDSRVVLWHGIPVKGADAGTFQTLDDFYSRDQDHIYYRSQPIPGADPKTFQILGPGFAKDTSAVYYYGQKKKNLDAASFVFLGGNYSKDKNHVYTRGSTLDSSEPYLNVFAEADPATFVVEKNSNHGIDDGSANLTGARDKNKIYAQSQDPIDQATFEFLPFGFGRDKNFVYNLNYPVLGKVAGVDPKSFQVLSEDFYKDNSHVYYIHGQHSQEGILPKADPATFQVLKYGYGRDKTHVYNWDELMASADISTFEVLELSYAKDRSTVYYNGKKIMDADPTTFQVLTDTYAVDKNNLFFNGGRFGDRPDDSFQVIGNGFAKDSRRIYFRGFAMAGADPVTFTLFDKDEPDFHYAKDKNSVYVSEKKIEGADPQTFEKIAFTLAKDTNHLFDLERMVDGVDLQTVETLESSGPVLFKDKNNVYSPLNFDHKKIDGIDAATFVYLGHGFYKDKAGLYNFEFDVRPVLGTDIGSVEILGQYIIKDKNGVYLVLPTDSDIAAIKTQKIAGADTATYELLEGGWGKDASHVFYREQIVQDADPVSFIAWDWRYAQDKNGEFVEGVKKPATQIVTQL